MKISIYGIGNFGYAFLKHLDRKNNGDYDLMAFDYNPKRVEYLTKHHRHPVLHTDVTLSENIDFTNNQAELLDDCDVLLLAVPSTATREVLGYVKKHVTKPIVILNTAKALDKSSGSRLSEVVREELDGSGVDYRYALLAGGTIAKDLFSHEPLGADIACDDATTLSMLVDIFSADTLNIYPTTDIVGVEYAGAFKNVISILAGMVNGMGMSYGSETHMISHVAQKISEACIATLGARPETFGIGSQCWGNDMWMSCTGNTRNREFGIMLGKGMPAKTALAELAKENKLVEGVNTLDILQNIPSIRDIEIIRLLHEHVVSDTSDVEDVRQYILRG